MRGFLKRHVLWAGFLAVLIPLLVLLVLQYRWLTELEKKSAIAHEATLNNYIEAVDKNVRYYYASQAERGLNVPSYLFVENKMDKIGAFFAKRKIRGARRLFVLSFVRADRLKLLFYDPLFASMEPPTESAEARAVYVAAAPWQVMAKEETELRSVSLTVDERDPENRIILNPIVDDRWRVVGVAGMIVDQAFFEEELLPAVFEESMPGFFNLNAQENLFIHAHNASGDIIGLPAEADALEDEAQKSLTFLFTDYTVGVHSSGMDPGKWAQTSFRLNMSLSIVVAVVLLGGVILALRTADREMKLSDMKGEFVSNVSHELRTPLASIRVFSEFLRLGRVKDPEKIREYGDYIETESRRLTGLVNNLLDFSKIETDNKTYRFEEADLGKVVEDTLRTFEVRLRNSGFRLTLDRPEMLPPGMFDPDAISQALSNLLDNAVKYSNGATDISVKMAEKDGWLVISVRDQGVGISSDEQRKVFERFHRVSTGLVHDVKGSGLGLSIVKHIVQAHRGRVTVESRPGRGSTFTIHLPLEAAENA